MAEESQFMKGIQAMVESIEGLGAGCKEFKKGGVPPESKQ